MADIIGKASGFNYTQRWGSQSGSTGGFSAGSRPVPEADWNLMSDEEKLATMGTTSGSVRDQMDAAYKQLTVPKIEAENEQAANLVVRSGAQTPEQARAVLLQAGYDPSIHANGPLFKQIEQLMRGAGIQTPSAWKPGGYSDYTDLSGLEAVKAWGYSPAAGAFTNWVSSHAPGTPTDRDPSTGYIYNVDPSGRTTYYDDLGYVVDPRTGQRTGDHYAATSNTRSYAGGSPGFGGGAYGGVGGVGSPTGSQILSGFGGYGGGFAPGANLDFNQMLQQLTSQLSGTPLPGAGAAPAQGTPKSKTPTNLAAYPGMNPTYESVDSQANVQTSAPRASATTYNQPSMGAGMGQISPIAQRGWYQKTSGFGAAA